MENAVNPEIDELDIHSNKLDVKRIKTKLLNQ